MQVISCISEVMYKSAVALIVSGRISAVCVQLTTSGFLLRLRALRFGYGSCCTWQVQESGLSAVAAAKTFGCMRLQRLRRFILRSCRMFYVLCSAGNIRMHHYYYCTSGCRAAYYPKKNCLAFMYHLDAKKQKCAWLPAHATFLIITAPDLAWENMRKCQFFTCF